MAEPELPSQVTDKDFLYLPQEEDVSGDKEWAKSGKWILHLTEYGMEMLDKTWLCLQPLLADSTLIMLKASTALKEVEHAHIQCFTRPGKDRAKKAADAIRKVLEENQIDFTGIMYYKQNELTVQKRACRYGDRNHSTYMHTFLGRFYKRDALNSWELVDDDESKSKSSIPRKYCCESETFSESYDLPATSAKRFQVLERDGRETFEANWYVYCSCLNEDDRYLAPADRLWIMAVKLYNRAVFSKISWSKRAGKVEIRFYVTKESDVFTQLSIWDEMFHEASVRGIMYYRNGSDSKYHYKYTSEKELYEQRQSGEIYLPYQEG